MPSQLSVYKLPFVPRSVMGWTWKPLSATFFFIKWGCRVLIPVFAAEGDYIGWSPVSSQTYPSSIRKLFVLPAASMKFYRPDTSTQWATLPACREFLCFIPLLREPIRTGIELALWVHDHPRGVRKSVVIARKCEQNTNKFYPCTKTWALRSLDGASCPIIGPSGIRATVQVHSMIVAEDEVAI